MRHLMPRLAHLLVVLLLLQWGGGVAACAGSMPFGLGGDAGAEFDPSRTVCHGGDAPLSHQQGPDQQGPGQHASLGCSLCAPLPPSLMPTLPVFPSPRPAVVEIGMALPAVADIRLAALDTPQQPRAPPALS